MLDVGPVILDQHVGLGRHAPEDLLAFRLLQIERQAALVAMKVLEVEAVALAAELLLAIAEHGLDLDDIGAPIGEMAHAGRAGTGARQVDHLETGEGQTRHGELPRSSKRSAARGGG